MATLYVRDVPDELYDALRERAGAEGRSISAEALHLLKRVIEEDREDHRRADAHVAALSRMRQIRESLTLSPGYPDSTKLLREDRER